MSSNVRFALSLAYYYLYMSCITQLYLNFIKQQCCINTATACVWLTNFPYLLLILTINPRKSCKTGKIEISVMIVKQRSINHNHGHEGRVRLKVDHASLL